MIIHLQFMLKIYLLNQKTVQTIPYFILKLNILAKLKKSILIIEKLISALKIQRIVMPD